MVDPCTYRVCCDPSHPSSSCHPHACAALKPACLGRMAPQGRPREHLEARSNAQSTPQTGHLFSDLLTFPKHVGQICIPCPYTIHVQGVGLGLEIRYYSPKSNNMGSSIIQLLVTTSCSQGTRCLFPGTGRVSLGTRPARSCRTQAFELRERKMSG